MKANELRIGNIYKHPLNSEKYTKISHSDFISGFIDSFKPIPLTEEWLLKFGFVKDSISDLFLDINDTHFLIWDNKRLEFQSDESDDFICFCESVHQLQNLYFALTSEELTLND